MNYLLFLLALMIAISIFLWHDNRKLQIVLDEYEKIQDSNIETIDYYRNKYNNAIITIDQMNVKQSSMMVTMMQNNSGMETITPNGVSKGGANELIH